ncbi:DUF4202 domain-containing protein [Saccharophagus degradans]|uniref:DUF4202 domain-containing protein n=1 Tax=Saccharophagus degradans TaxID=86304 RepID=UPI001C08C19E|nr:DUF4202 domain-containing protein [Saccharophagus degradans]MBU2987295.1 DUF4202 domain-containing protein [Saccharophagus degradans]
MNDKYLAVINKIDAANAQDPNQETSNGELIAKELLYSQRMTEVLNSFAPQASEHLQIAARAQHIERWKSPRSDYPEGRTGYKQWRAELGLFHAKRTGELMLEAGYSEEDINRVKYLVQKRGLRRDPETQTLEDVICLVFVLYYLDDFARKHDEAKLIDIIQKTWAKMSDAGHQAAVAATLPDHLATLIKKALSE